MHEGHFYMFFSMWPYWPHKKNQLITSEWSFSPCKEGQFLVECPRAISRAGGAVDGVLLGAFSHNTNDLNDVRIKRRRVFLKRRDNLSLLSSTSFKWWLLCCFFASMICIPKSAIYTRHFYYSLAFLFQFFRLSCCAISFVAWAIFIP